MAIFTSIANNVNVVFLIIPANTKAVPTHCLRTRLLPKKMTEAKTVKNFLRTFMDITSHYVTQCHIGQLIHHNRSDLVVVMMEQGRGPKSETVMKMKNWPKAEATEKEASSQRTEGWR